LAQSIWIQTLQKNYVSSDEAQQLLAFLAIQNPTGNFSLQHGIIIKYKNAIWLGHSVDLQNKVT
jgi:hypothetical protein